MFSLLSLIFSLQQNWIKRAEQVLPGSEKFGWVEVGAGAGGRDGPYFVYTYE
jgi:hypothetical protein